MTQQNITGVPSDYQDTIILKQDVIFSPSIVTKDSVYLAKLLMARCD